MCAQMDRFFDAGMESYIDNFAARLKWRAGEDENGVLNIEMELPGFSKEDVAVEVTDGKLHLSGSRKPKVRSESIAKDSEQSQRHYQFKRSFSLDSKYDATKMSGQLKDGLLSISMPKTEPTVHKISLE